MSSADTQETVEEAQEVPTDERREALLARFAEHLGDDLLDSHLDPGVELWIRVPVSAWREVHRVARYELGFKFFEFLSAIDWLPSPFGKSEDATVDVAAAPDASEESAGADSPGDGPSFSTGVAGGDTRFQVFSRLMDISEKDLSVIVKADVPDGASVESIIGVYPGANWHERELHEMFGIVVDDHPYLEKLYLPTGFEGFPLRKDFPLLARHVKPWPGIVDVEAMPEDDEDADAADDGTGDDA